MLRKGIAIPPTEPIVGLGAEAFSNGCQFGSQTPAFAVWCPDEPIGGMRIGHFEIGGVPVDRAIHTLGDVPQEAGLGERASVGETGICLLAGLDGAHPIQFMAVIRDPWQRPGWALVLQVPAQRKQFREISIDTADEHAFAAFEQGAALGWRRAPQPTRRGAKFQSAGNWVSCPAMG